MLKATQFSLFDWKIVLSRGDLRNILIWDCAKRFLFVLSWRGCSRIYLHFYPVPCYLPVFGTIRSLRPRKVTNQWNAGRIFPSLPKILKISVFALKSIVMAAPNAPPGWGIKTMHKKKNAPWSFRTPLVIELFAKKYNNWAAILHVDLQCSTARGAMQRCVDSSGFLSWMHRLSCLAFFCFDGMLWYCIDTVRGLCVAKRQSPACVRTCAG